MQLTDLLKILIGELMRKLNRIGQIIPREASFAVAENKIKVAIGMRRVGKTYFVLNEIQALLASGAQQSEILYINFEDDRLFPLSSQKLADLTDAFYALYPENHQKKCYLFFDEVQNIDDWATVVRRLHDTRDVEIYLTGSSAKLLSKEIATSLRGRSLATEIWPYCFSEYLTASGLQDDNEFIDQPTFDKLAATLKHYLHCGGFPEVIHYHQSEWQQTLQDYVDVVIFRDIVERNHIANPSVIKYMISVLLQNISSPFSINKLYQDMKSQGYKVSKDTLYDYAAYIEDAYLVFFVPLFDASVRKVQTNPKKIYAIDTGLVQASTFVSGESQGKLFENLIYLELRRADFTVYYYLTAERYEIDFVAESRNGQRCLIQVAWDTRSAETLAREERALAQASEELGIPGKLITMNDYLRGRLFPLFNY